MAGLIAEDDGVFAGCRGEALRSVLFADGLSCPAGLRCAALAVEDSFPAGRRAEDLSAAFFAGAAFWVFVPGLSAEDGVFAGCRGDALRSVLFAGGLSCLAGLRCATALTAEDFLSAGRRAEDLSAAFFAGAAFWVFVPGLSAEDDVFAGCRGDALRSVLFAGGLSCLAGLRCAAALTAEGFLPAGGRAEDLSLALFAGAVPEARRGVVVFWVFAIGLIAEDDVFVGFRREASLFVFFAEGLLPETRPETGFASGLFRALAFSLAEDFFCPAGLRCAVALTAVVFLPAGRRTEDPLPVLFVGAAPEVRRGVAAFWAFATGRERFASCLPFFEARDACLDALLRPPLLRDFGVVLFAAMLILEMKKSIIIALFRIFNRFAEIIWLADCEFFLSQHADGRQGEKNCPAIDCFARDFPAAERVRHSSLVSSNPHSLSRS